MTQQFPRVAVVPVKKANALLEPWHGISGFALQPGTPALAKLRAPSCQSGYNIQILLGQLKQS